MGLYEDDTYEIQIPDNLPELPPDAWSRRNDPEVRELIVLTYWPMLTRLVGSMRHKLPPHVRVEENDLRHYALEGMFKMLDKYDPEQGTPFDKYASARMYGAVIDALRKQDFATRTLRNRQKDLERATAEMTEILRRTPEDWEIAEHLRWTTADIDNTRKQIDMSWPRSLDELRGAAEQDLYAVVANEQGNPEQHVLGVHDSHENDRSTILTEKMALFIQEMPVRKKVVAIFCYYLDMKQSDVAAVLGIPASRVSALHLSIMEDIHERLAELLSEES